MPNLTPDDVLRDWARCSGPIELSSSTAQSLARQLLHTREVLRLAMTLGGSVACLASRIEPDDLSDAGIVMYGGPEGEEPVVHHAAVSDWADAGPAMLACLPPKPKSPPPTDDDSDASSASAP